jgi:N-methylhydantoinase B
MAFFGSGAVPETMPVGILGGDASQVNRMVVHRTDGTEIEVAPNVTMTLQHGDWVESFSAGGGGCGHPFERDPERVRADVRDEFVSVQTAREQYGVAIDAATMDIDEVATRQLREIGRVG